MHVDDGDETLEAWDTEATRGRRAEIARGSNAKVRMQFRTSTSETPTGQIIASPGSGHDKYLAETQSRCSEAAHARARRVCRPTGQPE